jgi:hypothetical protein
VSRPRVPVATPALALRRAEAAAALGISLEVFDQHVRPHVPAGRLGSVTVYPVAGLTAWLEREASAPIADLRRNVA